MQKKACVQLRSIAWSMFVHMCTLKTLIVLLASIMSTTTGTGDEKTMYGSAEKKPRKSSGSGGVFSDSDTPLESPSSVATNATIVSSDSGSEMELGHPSSSLLSASSTEAVVDTDCNELLLLHIQFRDVLAHCHLCPCFLCQKSA